MDVAFYSFKRIEVGQVHKIGLKIKEENPFTDKIYIYTENTNKQRISCRQGFRQMVEDYKKSKFDVIIFESFKSMSEDEYTRGLMLKELMKQNIKFYFLDKHLTSNSEVDKSILLIQVYIAESIKKSNNQRSKKRRKLEQTNIG